MTSSAHHPLRPLSSPVLGLQAQQGAPVFQVLLGSPGAPGVSRCFRCSRCLWVPQVSPGVPGVSGWSRCLWVPQVFPGVPGVSRCFRCLWVFQASCSAASLSSFSWGAEVLPGQPAYVVSPASPGPSPGPEEFHLVPQLFLSHNSPVLLLQHHRLKYPPFSGLGFGGPDLQPSCITLSWEPFQCVLKVRDQQSHIICKEQRSKTEAPNPETLLTLAAPPDPVQENHGQGRRQKWALVSPTPTEEMVNLMPRR